MVPKRIRLEIFLSTMVSSHTSGADSTRKPLMACNSGERDQLQKQWKWCGKKPLTRTQQMQDLFANMCVLETLRLTRLCFRKPKVDWVQDALLGSPSPPKQCTCLLSSCLDNLLHPHAHRGAISDPQEPVSDHQLEAPSPTVGEDVRDVNLHAARDWMLGIFRWSRFWKLYRGLSSVY